MWIGKIGAKSSAFINHKPFHPANLQNLQKVWEAEEKHRNEQQRIKEILEKREEERKISELRKALNTADSAQTASTFLYATVDGSASDTLSKPKGKRKQLKIKRYREDEEDLEAPRKKERFLLSSKYEEDTYCMNHTSVWGSFYDRDTNQWGYACCSQCSKLSACTQEDADADFARKQVKKGIREDFVLSEKVEYGRQTSDKDHSKVLKQNGLAEVLAKLKAEDKANV